MARKAALNLRDHGAPDLDQLLELAKEKSAAGRRALFGTVRDLFFESEGGLTERERVLMGDILRKLVRDVEMTVRKDLAERLADNPDAPHDLMVALANDAIEVAAPVLSQSTVLHDIDLIEIVRHRTQAHQLSVAMRKSVSEDVSQALVDTGDVDVITTLLKNEDAAISRSVMEYLVAESKRVDTFQQPLVDRKDLPGDLARRMYWWVSAALRKHIIQTFDVDPTTLDDDIEGTVKEALAREEAAPAGPSEAEAFADQLAERGKLTPDFVVQVLRQGEVSLFEACFARITDLKLKLVRRILYEPGGEALALACRGAGFDRARFLIIYQLTREGMTPRQTVDAREAQRVGEFFDRVERTHAQTVMRRWRRDSEYLYAIKQVGEA